ncbi:hypothetical protein NOCD_16110 [Nocardioides cavernae]|nr:MULTISPECIES: hypothetical protein [Nocardioides]MCK9825008.1 hypothetical protein [Nocardioides cavernae]
MRTHTYQYGLATPVPDSTPPEHQPSSDDGPLEPYGPEPRAGRHGVP